MSAQTATRSNYHRHRAAAKKKKPLAKRVANTISASGIASRVLDNDVLGALVAEFLGTFALVLFGTGVATAAGAGSPIAGPAPDSFMVAASFGAALFVGIMLFGKRSGANFNPAITIGLWVFGKMNRWLALGYIVSQLIGACAGNALVHVLFARNPQAYGTGYGVTQATQYADTGTVLIVEFLGTMFLTLTVASVALSKQPALDTALAIGVVLFVCIAFGGPLTGGAFNPARAIGPMIVSGASQDWPAYLAGEVLGGLVGMGLHIKYFHRIKQPE